MFTEKVTYMGYDNEERTEVFHFNLTQAEVTEMELSEYGGLTEYIQAIIDAKDGPSIIAIFKKLLLMAYGEKSPDGRRFVKSEELSKAFSETPAYNHLFMKLATDDEYAAKFVNGIMPKELQENQGNAIANVTPIAPLHINNN